MTSTASELDHQIERATEAEVDADVEAMVARAVTAQETFENWTDLRVDALLRELANAFADQAEDLAMATVAETGLGNVEDKTIKNRFASLTVFESIAGKITQGQIAVDARRQVSELASPVGVIFAIVPQTGPVETAIFKMLIALKTRNALILSVPRQAFNAGRMAAAIAHRVLIAHRAPADVVQIVERPGRVTARRFMSHPRVSLVLATGGTGLVKAAYRSGTPAIGVGPGNAPAWVCADAHLERAAAQIVGSKAFDNGLICGAEHNLVVDDRVVPAFVESLTRYGAAVLTRDEERLLFRLGAVDLDSGQLRRDFIGQPAQAMADVLGIERPYPIRLLVVPSDASTLSGFYAGEKLAPWLSFFPASGEDQGLRLCRMILRTAGAGHTAIIHTTSRARMERFARVMPAGRILINAPGAQGCCGMTTGLEHSLSLGCGTYGGNSTTDNITWRHLLNIKRVAHNLQ